MVGEGVGYLRLAVFSAPVSTLVYAVIQRLAEQGMRALVLDLRGNPGGDLDACLRLAADFLPGNSVWVAANGSTPTHQSRRAADGTAIWSRDMSPTILAPMDGYAVMSGAAHAMLVGWLVDSLDGNVLRLPLVAMQRIDREPFVQNCSFSGSTASCSLHGTIFKTGITPCAFSKTVSVIWPCATAGSAKAILAGLGSAMAMADFETGAGSCCTGAGVAALSRVS